MLADRNTLAKRIPPRMLPVLGDILGGLLYISAFSLVYLKKAYDHCLELGITRKELSNVIKSSLIFSVVPSLSIVVGLFASSSSGSKVVKGGIKGVLPVLIIMTVLSLAARLAGYGSVLGGLVGIFIIVMLPIGILTSYVLWKKGKIQVVDKEQKEK